MLVIAAPLTAKPAKPPLPVAPGIAVGQVLNNTLGKTVNGWLHNQGSMFGTSETKDSVTTIKLDCCIAVFSKGNSFIVARTEPLARNPAGGVIREKVIAVQRIDLRPGEVETQCSLFVLDLVVSVRNPKSGWVRSVVVSEGTLGLLEWRDNSGRCGEDGP